MTDDLFDLADSLGFQTPARRDPLKAPAKAFVAVEETGGPGRPPARTGEEPTPGSAAAAPVAARESTGAVVARGAGAHVPGAEGLGCKGRAGGAVGAATFILPPTPPAWRP